MLFTRTRHVGWAAFGYGDLSLMVSDPQDAQVAGMLQMLDQLEAHVRSGRRIALVSTVGVDQQKLLTMIDYLRIAIPTEIKQARRVVRDRQQIILDAQQQAEQIVTKAHQQAEYVVSRHGVLAEARQRGEDWLREADDQSRRKTDGAEQYALSVIQDLEGVMREQMRELERARTVLAGAKEQVGEAVGAQGRLDR